MNNIIMMSSMSLYLFLAQNKSDLFKYLKLEGLTLFSLSRNCSPASNQTKGCSTRYRLKNGADSNT